MNLRILWSGLPVAVFYALSRVADPWVAILGGFIASAVVYWFNRRDTLMGMLTLFGFVVVTVSAAIGIISNSEKAYLASGPAADFLFVPLYAVSIFLKKPLIGAIAREMFPKYAGHIPIGAPVFVALSVFWAAHDIVQGVARTYLLQELSVGEYIIWSRVLNWPFTVVMLWTSMYFVMRAAKRYENAGAGDDATKGSFAAAAEPGG
ncbi:MAG: hypothetical protein AB7T37_15650 [Dehalococcoidia bacterium]